MTVWRFLCGDASPDLQLLLVCGSFWLQFCLQQLKNMLYGAGTSRLTWPLKNIQCFRFQEVSSCFLSVSMLVIHLHRESFIRIREYRSARLRIHLLLWYMPVPWHCLHRVWHITWSALRLELLLSSSGLFRSFWCKFILVSSVHRTCFLWSTIHFRSYIYVHAVWQTIRLQLAFALPRLLQTVE